jgi:hypothetical protein
MIKGGHMKVCDASGQVIATAGSLSVRVEQRVATLMRLWGVRGAGAISAVDRISYSLVEEVWCKPMWGTK